MGSSSPPADFTCPISLELMADPVTIESGITFDRLSIERWLSFGHRVCPVTRLPLHSLHLVPNRTLQSLINAWIGAPGDTVRLVAQLCRSGQVSNRGQLLALRRVRVLAMGEEPMKANLRSCGAVPAIASLVVENTSHAMGELLEESVATLSYLNCQDEYSLAILAENPACLGGISRVLRQGSANARVHAAKVVETLCTQRRLRRHIGQTDGTICGLIQLLAENHSPRAVRSCLCALTSLCASVEENRISAIRAGALAVLAELPLIWQLDRFLCEKALSVLELLLLCEEGRQVASRLSGLIPTLVARISSVSDEATEYAIGALWAICTYSPYLSGYLEAIRAGALPKVQQLLDCDNSVIPPRTRQQGKQLSDALRTASHLLEKDGLTQTLKQREDVTENRTRTHKRASSKG